MALTLNNFSGAETGGLEETSAIVGAPFSTTGNVRTGSRSYAIPNGDAIEFDPFLAVTDAGDDYIIGAGVRFTDATPPTANQRFLSLREGTEEFLALELATNGDLLVIDANDGTIRTITAPFTSLIYTFIEVHFQHVASGIVEVFLDNISQGQDTAQDLTNGGTFNTVRFEAPASTGEIIQVEDYYCFSGAAAASDRLGDAEVFMYQNTVEDATDQGDTLSFGTWANVGETPVSDASEAQYTDTGDITGSTICDEGARPGPSGDANVDEDSNINGAKWVGRFSRGNGSPRVFSFLIGNNVDGVTAKVISLTNALQNFEEVSELAAEVPLSTEDFQHGFSKDLDGGQIINCTSIWAMLLHVPLASDPASDAGLFMPGQHQPVIEPVDVVGY